MNKIVRTRNISWKRIVAIVGAFLLIVACICLPFLMSVKKVSADTGAITLPQDPDNYAQINGKPCIKVFGFTYQNSGGDQAFYQSSVSSQPTPIQQDDMLGGMSAEIFVPFYQTQSQTYFYEETYLLINETCKFAQNGRIGQITHIFSAKGGIVKKIKGDDFYSKTCVLVTDTIINGKNYYAYGRDKSMPVQNYLLETTNVTKIVNWTGISCNVVLNVYGAQFIVRLQFGRNSSAKFNFGRNEFGLTVNNPVEVKIGQIVTVGSLGGYSQEAVENIKNNAYNNGFNEGFNVGFGQGTTSGEGWGDWLGAIIDAPLKAGFKLLNFEIAGINLVSVICGIITVVFVVKIIKVISSGG